MKKRNFIIAILLAVAAVSVAVVSCKKETPDAKLNSSKEKTAFYPENITDMIRPKSAYSSRSDAFSVENINRFSSFHNNVGSVTTFEKWIDC